MEVVKLFVVAVASFCAIVFIIAHLTGHQFSVEAIQSIAIGAFCLGVAGVWDRFYGDRS